jgi:peptidoglycan/LPS O-acetylase OafA/YrhL
MDVLEKSSRFSEISKLLSQRMTTLDGIRGIAILMVVLHNIAPHGVEHASNFVVKIFLLACDSGWVGVQLFFVLSGFLITGILLDGKGNANQLRNFYIRRSLRIFPLYYVFLVVIFIILPLLRIEPIWLERTKNYEMWYWLYLINWVQPFTDKLEMGHIWSLAIEEQFYLLWPMLAIFLHKKTLAYVCLSLVVTAIIFRFLFVTYLPDVGTTVAYTFTVARYDALAIGALVALTCRNKVWFEYVKERSYAVTVSILAMIAALLLIYHEFAPVNGVLGPLNQTLIAILFGLLILLSVEINCEKTSIYYRILSSKLLTQFGKYSYAIYIFHLPVKFIWFSNYSLDPVEYEGALKLFAMIYNFSGVLLISTAMAFISWNILERHCLGYKRMFAIKAT